MKDKVIEFYAENYTRLRGIAKSYVLNDNIADELIQEVFLQVSEKNEIKLHNGKDETILKWLTQIIKINAISKTSRFYYKFIKPTKPFADIDEEVMEKHNTTLYEDNYIYNKEDTFVALEDSLCEIDWFHRGMFELYMSLGSYKSVKEVSYIPLQSVKRYVQQAKEELKNKITKKLKDNEL